MSPTDMLHGDVTVETLNSYWVGMLTEAVRLADGRWKLTLEQAICWSKRALEEYQSMDPDDPMAWSLLLPFPSTDRRALYWRKGDHRMIADADSVEQGNFISVPMDPPDFREETLERMAEGYKEARRTDIDTRMVRLPGEGTNSVDRTARNR